MRWRLPDSMRDDTGVIFASAFPGYDSFAEKCLATTPTTLAASSSPCLKACSAAPQRRTDIPCLAQEIRRVASTSCAPPSRRIPIVFDRRFLLRKLCRWDIRNLLNSSARAARTRKSMPPVPAPRKQCRWRQDWIYAGRCRRVIVISADDITSDHLIEWMGAGFLASGAAATDEVVEDAAIPFDRRRHGMIIGMGAAALVVESADAARSAAFSQSAKC